MLLRGNSKIDGRIVLIIQTFEEHRVKIRRMRGAWKASEDLEGSGEYLMAEELSLKPMTELFGLAFKVSLTKLIKLSGLASPSITK